MSASPRFASDFKPRDVGLSAAFAMAILVGAAASLHVAVKVATPRIAPVPSTQPIAVRVMPVEDVDAPLLKLGGKIDPSRLPDRVAPHARPRVEERAVASTKASQLPEDIPAKTTPLADPSSTPPPKDAEVTKHVDSVVPEVDAGAPVVSSTAGHSDGTKEGTETDPLKARAVDLYRARIAAWFSSRFGVHGSGLAKEELTKLRVHAVVHVGADHVVTSYSVTPSGSGPFDAAAKAALDGAKGQSLPPPPDNYPDIQQSDVSITFVCRENRCD